MTIKLFLIILFSFLSFTIATAEEKDGSDLVKVAIIPAYESYDASVDIIPIAIKFEIKKDWHIYWTNPGDSGLPTEFVLDENSELKLSELQFPTPTKIPFSGMANYGYEEELVVFASLRVPKRHTKTLNLKGTAFWLVCKDICLPGEQSLQIEIPHKDLIPNYEYQTLEKKYRNKMPVSTDVLKANASITDDKMKIEIDYENLPDDIQFFPFEAGYIVNGKDQKVEFNDKKTYLSIELDNYREGNPEKLSGLLISKKGIKLTNAEEIYNSLIINFNIQK